MDIENLRKEYRQKSLSRSDLSSSPFEQFSKWLSEAISAGVVEANAMALSTASPEGFPGCRMVLLKHFNEKGFVFYTNIQSRKAYELSNPRAALTFWWKELERQVCIDGYVERVSKEEATRYFSSRPKGSQIGSWASKQGKVVSSRRSLDLDYQEFEKRFSDHTISPPDDWGGYRVIPYRIEFWQGRQLRLHDRFQYRFVEENWIIERLYP